MPGVDMLLTLSVSVVRLSRALPAAVLSLWTAVLCAPPVRGASRVQPDWTILPKDTPFGPMPSTQAGFSATSVLVVMYSSTNLVSPSDSDLFVDAGDSYTCSI